MGSRNGCSLPPRIDDDDMSYSKSSLDVPSFPSINSQQVSSSKESRKVCLKPGHSLMDWIRYANEHDCTGTNGNIRSIPYDELKKHNTLRDCWMALNGNVYNITPYLEFHPGGEDELMKGAGIDGTKLFNDIHKWVNAESMLRKCFIGPLEKLVTQKSKSNSLFVPSTAKSNLLFVPPTAIVPIQKLNIFSPRHEWYQNDSNIFINLFTKEKDIINDNVVIDNTGKVLTIAIYFKDDFYQITVNLSDEISTVYKYSVKRGFGKIEFKFNKIISKKQWVDIGEVSTKLMKSSESVIRYRQCNLKSKKQLTHDTYMLVFELQPGSTIIVPWTYHVHLRKEISEMEISRSYTVIPQDIIYGSCSPMDKGRFINLMIKFYENGTLTPILHNMAIGDSIDISDYDGNFDVESLRGFTDILMIAAGTGFTPMASIICYSINTGMKFNSIKLLFFNKTEQDIIWKDYLNEVQVKHNNFEVIHILSQPNISWNGLSGHINSSLLTPYLVTQVTQKQIFFVCGPTLFTKETMNILDHLQVSKDRIHAFLG